MVVAHPYDSAGAKVGAFEVLELSAQGKLAKTGKTFQLSPAFYGEIAFTRDGEIGLVPTDNGTVAVFRLDAERHAEGHPRQLRDGGLRRQGSDGARARHRLRAERPVAQ